MILTLQSKCISGFVPLFLEIFAGASVISSTSSLVIVNPSLLSIEALYASNIRLHALLSLEITFVPFGHDTTRWSTLSKQFLSPVHVAPSTLTIAVPIESGPHWSDPFEFASLLGSFK